MKVFLQRYAGLIAGLAIVSIIGAGVLGFLLYGARLDQQRLLARVDDPGVRNELPGPNNRMSERSILQMDTLLGETPHVLGGWAMKIHYTKTENPVFHYYEKIPEVGRLMKIYDEIQLSGKGFSSAELNAASEQSLRNTEEAKTGLIRCAPLETTNLPKLSPEITKYAKGVCRATIPPFDPNVNLAIVVPVDIETQTNSPEIQAIRRVLLQLQIDIYNRDYQGRETWARSI